MNIETSYLSFVDNELWKRSLVELRPLDIDLRDTDTVRRAARNHSECGLECGHSQSGMRSQIHSSSKSRWIIEWSCPVIKHIAIWSVIFLILDYFYLNLELIWIAKTLGISLNVSYEVKAILYVIAADEATLESNHCILFIWGDDNLNNGIIFWRNFKSFDEFMLSDHNSSIMSDLKYSGNALVITDNDKRHLRIHSDRSELQVGGTLVIQFARVCERVIETLNNVDIWKLPPIAEVPPNKKTHVICTCDKRLSLMVFCKVFPVDWGFSDPLHAGHTLEVTERVAHNGLRWTANWPVYHHKWGVTVLNH